MGAAWRPDDQTSQLVDCHADPQTINGKSILQIAQLLAGPYGVENWIVDNEANRSALIKAKRELASFKKHRDILANALTTAAVATGANAIAILEDAYSESSDSSVRKRIDSMRRSITEIKSRVFPKIKIEPGQTVYAILEELASKLDLLVWCAADGTGIIAKPNYNQEAIYNIAHHPRKDQKSRSNNIKSGSVTWSGSDRFSTYRVLATNGNTKLNYEKNSRYDVTMIDPDVGIDRKIILTADSSESRGETDVIASREYSKRAFDSIIATYTMPGHGNNGKLWQIDTLCRVDDSFNGLADQMYVTSRRFSGDVSSGQVTEVTLKPYGVFLS